MHPGIMAWMKAWRILFAVTHYCQWVLPFLKPTKIAANYSGIVKLTRHCQGGHPHITLRGTDENGIFLTAKAAAYPPKMCSY